MTPSRRLDRARRHGEQHGERERQHLPARAEQQARRERERDGRADHRALRADERDERRSPRRTSRECCRSSRARTGGPTPRRRSRPTAAQPDRERAHDAEQRHRDGEERERREERADGRAERRRVQLLHRRVENRPRDERDQCDRRGGDEHDPPEQRALRPPVCELAAEPVADRQVHEDQPDHVRPDDRRAAEERREQPRGADLHGKRRGARDEDDRAEAQRSDLAVARVGEAVHRVREQAGGREAEQPRPVALLRELLQCSVEADRLVRVVLDRSA